MEANTANHAAADADAALEELDPVAARAQFFFDLELAELRATIPQAQAPEGKQLY